MSSRIPSRFAFVGGLAGFAAGLLVWRMAVGLATHLRPIPSRGLEEARELGLISYTVLNNYDCSQESVAWLLGCIIVPLSLWAVLAALLPPPPGLTRPGRRRRGDERRQEDERRHEQREERPEGRRVGDRRGPPSWFPWVALSATCLAMLVRPGFLRGPSPWGSFGLVGEEGVYLGAVQAIRNGRTLYADLDFPYGPLLIEPLSWWMHLFGNSIVSARAYVLLLTVLGLAAAAWCLRLYIGPARGAWWGLAAALSLALTAPLFLPTLNSVLLRTVLPFLPAALVLGGSRRLRYRETEESTEPFDPVWRCAFVAAGVCTGFALFFSFDSGAAALAGLVVATALAGSPLQAMVRSGLGLATVTLLVVLPMLLSGSFVAFTDQLVRMLHLPAIGYQALPYPDLFGLFVDGAGQAGSHPPENTATALWSILPPVLVWASLGIGLRAPRAGGRPTRNATLLVVALISALLFRAALGRSDLYHLWFYGSVPVVLLSLLLLERAWDLVRQELRPVLVFLALAGLVGMLAAAPEAEVRFPDEEEVRLAGHSQIADPLEPRELRLDRTGRMLLLPRLATQLEAIVARAEEFPEDDDIYFYPSEAAYYFLTDRPVPLRYLWAYDAATPEMQKLAIEDLEQSQPRWLFRSTDTFAIDHIPQTHLVPRIDSYLKEHYRLVEVLPGATLHERVSR
ncbi:MAG: hypothetical protein VX498_09550 [Myxococcota bacterium]|nr:hypothetical protein [Myxococcota bacterium]